MSLYEMDLDFETDTEELTPGQAHDRWESVTNLQPSELESLEDTREHGAYLDQASDKRQTQDPPIAGGPLEDAIHLAKTPRDEWGPDERSEAAEAIDWASRHGAQYKNPRAKISCPASLKLAKPMSPVPGGDLTGSQMMGGRD